MSLVDPRVRVAPVFPPGVDRARRLLPLYHSVWWAEAKGREAREHAARIRRDATRSDPLLFGLAYLPRYLSDEDGQISFSEMHLAISDRAARWVDGRGDRSAWASHRDAGKTVWWWLIVPLWALAHGHRRFLVMLSDTGDQAKRHFGNLRAVLETNDRLLEDFPGLRRSRPWTAADIVTAGGRRVVCGGLTKNQLGLRHAERRPDLVILDDISPGPATWTPAAKAKTLGGLTHDVLPMTNRNSAVVVVGCPVAGGCPMHDVVRAAQGRTGLLSDQGEWLRAATPPFDPYWWPAIVDAGTSRQRSAWPTKFPLPALLAEKEAGPEGFALQRQCDPVGAGWTDDMFIYDRMFSRHSGAHHIGSIDAAGTAGRDSGVDHTAFVAGSVVGEATPPARVCIDVAEAGSWDPETELLPLIWEWAGRWPHARKTLIVEANGPGAHLGRLLTRCGLPPGVVLEEPFHVGEGKAYRTKGLIAEYRAGRVLHADRLPKLEGQMTAWRPGASGHAMYDLIDAARALVDRALYGDAAKSPTRRTR